MVSLYSSCTRSARALAVSAIAASALALGLLPATAGAESAVFCGRAVHQAELCRGPFGNGLTSIFAENRTDPYPVCVAPVGWNGSGYTYPYGWQCGHPIVGWELGLLNGMAAGASNPNSRAEYIAGLYFFH